ncbi:D,D-heptose 1,7-bisphosphate phosphatase [Candidatus Photodesmus blepharus]|uniref:D,D-heptose 1,7-bisphosphate phosphatase n=1 Tax=Candidatus Photodesmus blepharonis TaxID=1179155 RepID=A0A084CPI3_9GAMM|nr:D-glycero-beta-D-manno-heptose 1,7-bisphosphate 7-phosphatase [Candidatus Photodesmus blepharus]KEY91712.1 D,D-heptose 1,7-bisphosphate phosphatase [Candidatus Photodesmus blepharus]
MIKPAIFLDRDGVINIDYGYVHNKRNFDFIENVFEATQNLKKMGYMLVLVTNQSGIAQGIFTKESFLSLTCWMNRCFSNNNVNFDAIYYCPHHAERGIGKYKKNCYCRKPNPGMLIAACKSLQIDMKNSAMIGDKIEDMMAAKSAGINTRILVRTGKSITDAGKKLATVVLDSIANVPTYLK